MKSNYSKFIDAIMFVGDFVCINIAFLIAYYIKFKSFSELLNDEYLTLFLVFNLAWILVVYVQKPYQIDRVTSFEKVVRSTLKLIVIHTLLITAFWVFRKAYYYSREQLMWTVILLYVVIFVWRGVLYFTLKAYREKGFNYQRIVIAGYGELSQQLINIIQDNSGFGYKLLAVFNDDKVDSDLYQGSIKDLEAYAKSNEIDEIYCSVPDLETKQVQELIQYSDNNLMRIKMIPDVRGFRNKRLKIQFFENLPVLQFRQIPLDDAVNKLWKRLFDIVFSLLVIICILSWLYPIIALLIKLSSSGPVLFKQSRSGLNNEEFMCWKFRTMVVNRDSDQKQATKNDARVTKIGAFLRKSSLDELPQFFNVLFGKMSVVGPRPHMVKHTEEYSAIINKYMVRHFVKPGITGLAQIKGYRGETKDPKMMENRIRMDMLYVESWTFVLDFWIVFRTVINAFKKEENAY